MNDGAEEFSLTHVHSLGSVDGGRVGIYCTVPYRTLVIIEGYPYILKIRTHSHSYVTAFMCVVCLTWSVLLFS